MLKAEWFKAALISAAVAVLVPCQMALAATMTLKGTPATTVTVNKYYYFKPSLSNATLSTTKFSISGRPSWASFNVRNGTISGTPTVTGTWKNIKISAVNGTRTATLPAFTVSVRPVSTVNVKISGTPSKTAEAGVYYSFRPTVSAASGAKLTYSITNRPSWASFSSTTGTLSGTPSTIATYSNITIRVTDSKTSASLPAFNIEVSKPRTGNALLSWVKPLKNTDGSALSNLAGYRVHYGTGPSSLTKLVTVAGANSTSAFIDGLSRGTWYFAVEAYTSAGIESALSPAAAKTIN